VIAQRVALAFLLAAPPLFAQGEKAPEDRPRGVLIDTVAVRFNAPDIGGAARPRFITRGQAAFEARLLALEEDPAGVVQPRHMRAAVDAHIAEEILAELPLDPPADARVLARTEEIFRAGIEQRIGGEAALDRAEKIDGFAAADFEAIVRREARAAIYLDRSLAPFLSIDEDQLREKYRTTSNPFRARRFEDVQTDLARWVAIETFRAAEQAYLESARSRIEVVYF
jgi:hypothetical protein